MRTSGFRSRSMPGFFSGAPVSSVASPLTKTSRSSCQASASGSRGGTFPSHRRWKPDTGFTSTPGRYAPTGAVTPRRPRRCLTMPTCSSDPGMTVTATSRAHGWVARPHRVKTSSGSPVSMSSPIGIAMSATVLIRRSVTNGISARRARSATSSSAATSRLHPPHPLHPAQRRPTLRPHRRQPG